MNGDAVARAPIKTSYEEKVRANRMARKRREQFKEVEMKRQQRKRNA